MRVTVIDTAYRNAIRQRLQDRLRATSERETAQRIQQAEQDRHNALLRRAMDLDMTLEPDTIKPGHFITRQAPTGRSGRAHPVTNVTSPTSCTCSEWQLWHRCPCQALVIDHVTFEFALAQRQQSGVAA